MRNAPRIALACAAVATLSAVPATANATPSSGVTSTLISQATLGGKDYIVRDITLAPGGSTGWHTHPGTLYAIVKQGTLTHNEKDCAVDGVYHAGQPLIEPSGRDHVHIGRNLGTEPVVLEVLYVDPAGSPLSEDAPNPGCDFQ